MIQLEVNMSIFAKREELTLFNEDSKHNETWSYISIYDENGKLLSRSKANHPEGHKRHEYDGLVYINIGHSDEVLVTFNSLKDKFSK